MSPATTTACGVWYALAFMQPMIRSVQLGRNGRTGQQFRWLDKRTESREPRQMLLYILQERLMLRNRWQIGRKCRSVISFNEKVKVLVLGESFKARDPMWSCGSTPRATLTVDKHSCACVVDPLRIEWSTFIDDLFPEPTSGASKLFDYTFISFT